MNDLTALVAASMIAKSNNNRISPIEKVAHIKSKKIFEYEGHIDDKKQKISEKRIFQFVFSIFFIIAFLIIGVWINWNVFYLIGSFILFFLIIIIFIHGINSIKREYNEIYQKIFEKELEKLVTKQ